MHAWNFTGHSILENERGNWTQNLFLSPCAIQSLQKPGIFPIKPLPTPETTPVFWNHLSFGSGYVVGHNSLAASYSPSLRSGEGVRGWGKLQYPPSFAAATPFPGNKQPNLLPKRRKNRRKSADGSQVPCYNP